jgi:hypothetical protein
MGEFDEGILGESKTAALEGYKQKESRLSFW